tara:strand:- start:871 stop:1992 length:1122 start_codon:yes stop_codon:yes gene_type:complete
MNKIYTAIGLMSGTSGDGVDVSIISSDGKSSYKVLLNEYFAYSTEIYESIHRLREEIQNLNNLKNKNDELKSLERKITLFHAKIISDISKKVKFELVGFHGQTIYHNPNEKISKQLGDGSLLAQLTKKNIVYNFRQSDIKNGGEGAPLTPIFHHLISKKNKIEVPSCILNIGGISNVTLILNYSENNFISRDIGPGNCLIDSWVRKNSNHKYDKNGDLASRGKFNDIILEQAEELYSNRANKKNLSLDVNDFDVSFARGLSLEDGSATLTLFTAKIIGSSLISFLSKFHNKKIKVLLSGGGRNNQILVNQIKQIVSSNIIIDLIDNHGVEGDYVESQAFAYLAIRRVINEPISFPSTTGCSSPTIGGEYLEAK